VVDNYELVNIFLLYRGTVILLDLMSS
jgi:hypothetical protein